MIAKALATLTTQLDDHLRRAFRLSEEIVFLQSPSGSGQPANNKLLLFLAHIERETAGGGAFNRQAVSGEHFYASSPAWQLNVYAMLAAVFSEKQYEEGLKLLSGATAFLQANNRFALSGTDTQVSIEPLNLPFSELSNLWSIHGNQYYPSLLCKLRNITIDANEIREIGTTIKSPTYDFK